MGELCKFGIGDTCFPAINCTVRECQDSLMLIEDVNARVRNRDIRGAKTPSSSRLRFILIGTFLVTTIIGATLALVWMQRNDAIAAYGDEQSGQWYVPADRAGYQFCRPGSSGN